MPPRPSSPRTLKRGAPATDGASSARATGAPRPLVELALALDDALEDRHELGELLDAAHAGDDRLELGHDARGLAAGGADQRRPLGLARLRRGLGGLARLRQRALR